MKENELMIGDWVYNSRNHKNERVGGVGERWLMLDYNDVYEYEEIELIPLTPEILEKNGFMRFDFCGIEGGHQWSLWIDNLTSVTLWCRELNDNPKDGWMIRVESQLATCCYKIESVHQLQQTMRLCKINKEIEL